YEYGIPRAYDLPMRVLLRRINTYLYMAMVPLELPPYEAAARQQWTESHLSNAIWTLQVDWTTRWLPEITSHLDYWEHLDLDAASTLVLVSMQRPRPAERFLEPYTGSRSRVVAPE